MKIEIEKQKRRTMSIRVISVDLAVVKVPKSVSQKQIENFLQSKQAWLNKVVLKLQQQNDFAKEFAFDSKVYIFGEEIASIDKLKIDGDKLSPEQKIKLRDKFYQERFYYLENLAKELSLKTGITYNQLKMCKSVRIWGSFSAQKIMKLNFKLVALPKPLAEYVIFHELCHAKHLNHSPAFWKAVEQVCPDYKQRKKALNQYGFVLKKDE